MVRRRVQVSDHSAWDARLPRPRDRSGLGVCGNGRQLADEWRGVGQDARINSSLFMSHDPDVRMGAAPLLGGSQRDVGLAWPSRHKAALSLPTLIRPAGERAKNDIDVASADACGEGIGGISIDVVRS